MAREQYHQARRRNFKASGVCIQCGESPPKSGHVRCGGCMAYQRERMAMARAHKRRAKALSGAA